MNVNHLNENWNKLKSLKPNMGLRVSGECRANLYQATNSSYNHCLMLWMKNLPLEISGFGNQNIKLECDKNGGYLTLTLLNPDYLGFFNEIIIEIHDKVKGEKRDDRALDCFLKSANKWLYAFKRQYSEKNRLKTEREMSEHINLVKVKILNRRRKDEAKGAKIDVDYFGKLFDRGSFFTDIINLFQLAELEDVTVEEIVRIWQVALVEHGLDHPYERGSFDKNYRRFAKYIENSFWGYVTKEQVPVLWKELFKEDLNEGDLIAVREFLMHDDLTNSELIN